MDITPKTKLADILTEYPHLEEIIIGLAPVFQNLRNPLLRRTVGRLASVEQAARIGNIDVNDFVNLLRRETGQPELEIKSEAPSDSLPLSTAGDPKWIGGEPQYTIDGTALLRRGEVPLTKINELLPSLSGGGYLLLITDFKPLPIIAAMEKKQRAVFHKIDPHDPNRHLTFIQ